MVKVTILQFERMILVLQTKFFESYERLEKMQDEINSWLSDHPQTVIKDIKFNCSVATYDEVDAIGLYSAMVIYEHD